ncbi:MAG: YegS/Rv2252/BmrU family lipid kinase, partial [Acidobacteriota bacterium]|nr:YegS/Rv2252/BmrU family lipid kinase [Acidobacteriota bacterium]
ISNGFFENKKIINPNVALGVVPSGTGCDFSKSLNIQSGLKNALRVITQASSSMIDIGKIRFRDHYNKKHERFFLNIADFGIGGEVLDKMNQKMAKRKTSSYLKNAVTTFITYKSKRVRMKIDNMQIPFNEYLIGAISNGRIFGKGMKIAPYAKLDDGLFDVVLVESMKFLEFCRNILKIYSGSHLSHPKVSLIRGKKIEISPESSEKDVLIEADGELIGKLPATFEIVPQSFLVKSFL